jgi:hypothetical protein
MLDIHLPRLSVVRTRWCAAPVAVVIALSLSVGTAHAAEPDADDDADASESEAAGSKEALRSFPVVETGAQAGFRTGFAKGFGKFAATSEQLSDSSRGFLPFWLDVGYRVHPSVFIGAYAQYGLVLLRKGGICEGEDTKCSGSNYRLGGQIVYHFAPDGDFDPWFGLGAGYEWYRSSVKYAESGIPNRSLTFKGPEWVNVSLGLDIHETRQGAIGPFVALAVGQYSKTTIAGTAFGNATEISETISATEMHQWLFFGVQGSYFDDL